MSLLKNFRDMFTTNTNDQYEDEIYDDGEGVEYDEPEHVTQTTTNTTNSAFRAARPAGGYNSVAQRSTAMRLVIIEPVDYEKDSQNIANQLRDMRPVVLNFESTEESHRKRIIDFMSGATYALDGTIKKVGEKIYLCVPSNVTVDSTEQNYADLTESLAWKEPQL
ncbi:cell division protein SepF [uncultured Veillonella sp.]|uniref:cell division protein SepF n=1 Tax=uncultured Veillonella sp. TaxID=159268 RepID=UPI0025E608A7|nr:cell division protein SepF [uncultured Veillonella sp.]MDY3973657.1 cell division protein SepF [Veillonella caviae]